MSLIYEVICFLLTVINVRHRLQLHTALLLTDCLLVGQIEESKVKLRVLRDYSMGISTSRVLLLLKSSKVDPVRILLINV